VSGQVGNTVKTQLSVASTLTRNYALLEDDDNDNGDIKITVTVQYLLRKSALKIYCFNYIP